MGHSQQAPTLMHLQGCSAHSLSSLTPAIRSAKYRHSTLILQLPFPLSGNLHPFISEAMLHDVFAGCRGVLELKIIKDKATGIPAGYGFAKFVGESV